MLIPGRDYKVTVSESEHEYFIECSFKEQSTSFIIKRSKVKLEWLIATTPAIYRSRSRNLIVLQNHHCIDIDENIIYRMPKPWQTEELTNDNVKHLFANVSIPEYQEKELCNIDMQNVTVDILKENFEKLPISIDVSNWRFHRTINFIVQEEIWKFLPALFAKNEIGRMSTRSLEYNMNILYRKNTEFCANEFKMHSVVRKVLLPLQMPKDLTNNWLCMTSTPQNDKAGGIAEIPVGAIIDENGYVIHKPDHTISVTSAQCPFPKRMLPNREVVLKAISQARQLQNPEIPVVCSYPTSWKVSNPIPRVDSVNLLSARMAFYGLTDEDGYVISQTGARKCASYHKAVDKFVLPKGFKLNVEVCDIDTKFAVEHFQEIMASKLPFINRGGIATIGLDEQGKVKALNAGAQQLFDKQTGTEEETKTKAIISKHRGIVIDIERREVDDVTEMVMITTLCKHELEIGAKITDRSSHKGTISAILPDWKMPKVRIPETGELKRLDIICPPWIGKRCTPSREMEEITSLNFLKTGERYVSNFEDSLDSIRERFGTNISPVAVNIDNDEFPVLAQNVPIGYVAFAVLDHIPSKKIRYSNKIHTNYAGRTKRGLKNYNFTDGLFAIIEHNADNLLEEIQSYSVDNNENMLIMEESLETFGFHLRKGHIEIMDQGVFKSSYLEFTPNLISKGLNKTEESVSDEMVKGTIYDKELDGQRIAIRLPAGIPLTHNELVKTLGSQTTVQSKVWQYLKLAKTQERMKKLNIPMEHVYSRGVEDRYLIVSNEMIYTYVDFTATRYPNKFMDKINNLVLLLNNTADLLKMPIKNEGLDAQLIRCNLKFNEIVDILAKRAVTKSGIIRETLSPRLPFTGYLVASNASTIPFNTVMLPLRMMISFANEERFRKSYNIPDDWDAGYLVNHFNKHDVRALVMRQPCHRRNEISSFIVRIWEHSSIGINSAAMKVKSGDHDGDALFTYMPIGEKAKEDLHLMRAEDLLGLVEAKKGLEDYEKPCMEHLQETFLFNTGLTEDISVSEHQERYSLYSKPMSDEEYRKLQANAANDFLYIKRGTANAGGIGNIVRHLLYNEMGRPGIKIGNNIYHNLAQAALDTKAGTETANDLDTLLAYLRSFKAPNRAKLETLLEQFLGTTEKEAMLGILYDAKGWRAGLSVIGAKDVPFSRLLYRGGIGYLYRASANKEENSVATLLANI